MIKKILNCADRSLLSNTDSQKAINDFFDDCSTHIENLLLNMSEVEKLEFMFLYLHWLGYDNLTISEENSCILIEFILPGNARLSGIGKHSRFQKMTDYDNEIAFVVEFDFLEYSLKHDSKLSTEKNQLRLGLNDYIRFSISVVAFYLHEDYRYSFKQSDFFNYYESHLLDKWSLKSYDLERVRKLSTFE